MYFDALCIFESFLIFPMSQIADRGRQNGTQTGKKVSSRHKHLKNRRLHPEKRYQHFRKRGKKPQRHVYSRQANPHRNQRRIKIPDVNRYCCIM